MMLKKISYCCVFILSLLYSCSSDQKNLISNNIVKIEEKYELYNSSDIFAEVKLIPLETNDNSLLSTVKKVVAENGKFYILDNMGYSIFVFSIDGDYLYKIDKRGRGNGEYIEISDFSVDSLGSISILSSENKSLFEYDSIGLFTKQYKLPFHADAFENINNNIIVFNGSAQEKRVLIWNKKDNEIIKTYIDYDKYFSSGLAKPLIKYKDKILFMQRYNNSLYRVSIDSINVDWSIDFGKKNILYNELTIGAYGAYYPKDECYWITNFAETDNNIIFKYQSIELDYPFYAYVFKDTKDKKILTYEYFNDDLLFNKLPPDILNVINKEELVSIIYPHSWRNNLLNYNSSTETNTERWSYVNSFIETIKDNDNPIIALYKLKK